MGNGLSDNYEEIEPLFVIGFWNVHKAIRKLNRENVSLWVLDQERIKNNVKKRQEKDVYLKSCLDSIQQMRRLCHPHILKVIEVNEDLSSLSFSSEPIKYSLIYEDMTNDEVAYLALQLADTMNFLHLNARIGHLSLSQNSIVINEDFDIKICEFNFASPISPESNMINFKGVEWYLSPFQPQILFSSPEFVINHQISTSTDVFSYGCVIASAYLHRQLFSSSTPTEHNNLARSITNQIPLSVPDEMRQILSLCLSFNPSERPSFEQILKSPAFLGIQSRVLSYLDMILTKDPADKFTYFKNLPSVLNTFSHRLQRSKFAPTFINEIKSDIRFAPVLIPLTVIIGKVYESNDFLKEIITPIGPALTCINPPEVLISTFSVMDILMDRIDSSLHYDLIYPIYIKGLQSDNPRLQDETIKHMPLLINSVSQVTIQTALFPKLLDFLNFSTNVSSIISCIQCFSSAIGKIESNWFSQNVIPSLIEIWKKQQNPALAPPLCEILESLRPSIENSLKFVIPLISEILSLTSVENSIQFKLSTFVIQQMERLKSERHLHESKWVEKAKDKITHKQPIQSPVNQSDELEFFLSDKPVQKNNNPRPVILPKKINSPNQITITNDTSNNIQHSLTDPPQKKTNSMFSGLDVQSKKTANWKKGQSK